MITAMTIVLGSLVCAAEEPPASAAFFVSKLGDNSDGRSWATAFNTLQAALDAVPDDKGGYRIVVRPDTYMEANLAPAFAGAEGAYNELIGDADGALGSGSQGRTVIDNSDPGRGFKSYDWYGTVRAYKKGWSDEHTGETFSGIVWDRWIIRNLYATGGDGAWMFDTVDAREPFTVILEDCVGIGRAFGGGVSSCAKREGEPSVFRRCTFWSLDEWGDTAAGYVRVENDTMPDTPDVIFEDCTLISPQCALKGNNYGFHVYSRIQLTRCKLIALNFSQPHGTPTDGIIQSVQNGKYLHVDLEDCVLMGFKVFGVKVDKDSAGEIGYTTKGDVRAHVQYTQDVPKGIHTQAHWPVDVFAAITMPQGPPRPSELVLQQREVVKRELCELSPIEWKGRLCHMESIRPGHGGTREDYYLLLEDAETGEELAKFALGYGLACAMVHDDTFYAFASRWEEDGSWNDVTMFRSKDLENWDAKVVVQQEDEHLFNSSVAPCPDGFVMAYESNDGRWPAFTTKFATSPDLETWTKRPESTFGTNRYTACPCIRWVNGYYYVLYLECRTPLHAFETYITRSKDLTNWELSAANPVLAPQGIGEGINASDPDLIEWNGQTWVYFAVGDQLTWMDIRRAPYEGSMQDFFERWYHVPGIPDHGTAR